ncbi:MAG: DUF692 domain-containing protein [Erythrobacter sp.]
MPHEVEPFRGFGLGLRKTHYEDFLAGGVPVDFVEVISENYMVDGGKPLRILEQVRCELPVILHGVSLSVGSADGLDLDYLARLKQLAERIEPLWMSDHLCWTRSSAHNSHDLLPLPLTREALDVVCDNLGRAQDALGRALLLENPSSYVTFPQDEMTEWEFLRRVAKRTGCHLLLDINNIVVSGHNHGFDAADYLDGLPLERVRQIHLAGHTPGPIAIDTHDRSVPGAVWSLYAQAIARLGPVATMIERDADIPPLPILLEELDTARHVAASSVGLAA